jgi:cation diffusion facilitator CzcD-associated flavoprotein CzcO
MGRITSTLQYALTHPLLFIYQIIQYVLDFLLSPTPPPPHTKLSRPKIAVIGAGITGVSSASHCVGHGFDCRIFEAGSKDSVGGIWSKVNNTSGLQIHSLMYRFHPAVHWTNGYPSRKQIVGQVKELWKKYGLEEKTHFETKVEKVYKDEDGRWIINDPEYGRFDGVIAAIGTCGDPKMPTLSGQEQFKGEIWHSSQLDGKTAKGKKVVIIGGGASAVEALEFVADTHASHTTVLARSEKWIIPRNPFVDILLALNIFGSETIFSWIQKAFFVSSSTATSTTSPRRATVERASSPRPPW